MQGRQRWWREAKGRLGSFVPPDTRFVPFEMAAGETVPLDEILPSEGVQSPEPFG
jgi:hypothetical protein